MEEKVKYSGRGGSRGGGRPTTDRNVAITIRISQEAADKLNRARNKSEFIDRLIKQADIEE